MYIYIQLYYVVDTYMQIYLSTVNKILYNIRINIFFIRIFLTFDQTTWTRINE